MNPEQAQMVTDLRIKMLSNIQAGKPAEEGISEAELAACIQAYSGPRLNALAAGEKKKRATKTASAKPAKPPGEASAAIKGLFDLLNKE
jgi:hypothetical protein